MPAKEHYERYKGYYQNYQRNRYHNDPEYRKRILQYQRTYRKNYPRDRDSAKENSKNYRDRLRRNWQGDFSSEITLKAEELTANQILPTLGFTKILWLTNKGFPHALWDILAVKDNSKFAVEVTTGIVQYFLKKTLWELLRFLDLEILVCFIHPNLNEYFLHQLPSCGLTGILYSNKKYLISHGLLT